MYWPIAAPKIYAASKQTAHKKTTTTDDGLQDLEPRDASKPSLGSSDLLRSEDNGDHGEETLLQNSEATRKEVAEVEEPEERRQSVQDNHTIVGMKVARSGHLFATITRSSLSIWQTKPTVLLATIARSEHSLNTYGPNVCLLLRPDALIIVVQTQLGYLITYSLATAPNARVYQTQLQHHGGSHARRPSADGIRKFSVAQSDQGPGEGDGIPEVNIRFRMVIRIDAGISKALVVDEELIVATQKPAAVQCIRWSPDRSGSSHSTELLKRMPWLTEKATIVNMIFDRPMNFHAWITGDGDVYAVQRLSGAKADPANPKTLFRGYCFHRAANEDLQAAVTAINARFSLIAVGCADASVQVYTAKDYLGNIPLSHTLRLPVSLLSSGKLEFLSYSPDGYCLFVGFEKGWATWSVYGKPGASSFTADHTLSKVNNEMWLHGAKDGFWVGAGCEIVLLSPHTDQICLLEMARSSATGCYAFANIGRSLIQASTSVMLYRGFDLPDVTAVPGEHSLWQTVQLPLSYLANQWPVRSTVISADGRYVAVAGRRGLAHYSVGSGRWKTFDDYRAENEFTVRGVYAGTSTFS
ncbi:WD40 repeat protein [Taxawa tesnikishii (nom. ined.)]|nr:WD40 repeat protein [Dothideales sp. JES 119]